MLVKYAQAFIYMPVDLAIWMSCLKPITLIQTHKIERVPILIGKSTERLLRDG